MSGKTTNLFEKYQLDRNIFSPKNLGLYALTFVLWALTAFLAVWEIFVIRAMVVRVATRYFMSQAGLTRTMASVHANTYGKGATLFMALIAIMVVILGFDYHFAHVGKRRSWKTFAWTLGIQGLILGLGFVF